MSGAAGGFTDWVVGSLARAVEGRATFSTADVSDGVLASWVDTPCSPNHRVATLDLSEKLI